MKINFSTHFQALADKFGDCDALAHPECGRGYAFREFHLLSNRVINMLHATHRTHQMMILLRTPS